MEKFFPYPLVLAIGKFREHLIQRLSRFCPLQGFFVFLLEVYVSLLFLQGFDEGKKFFGEGFCGYASVFKSFNLLFYEIKREYCGVLTRR